MLPLRLRRRTQLPDEHRCTASPLPVDLGLITHQCLCGSNWWTLNVAFDDFEIAAYLLEMTCACCGNKALAPTPVDRPGTL